MSSCRPSIRDNIPSVRAAGIAIAKAADHDTVGAALRIERPPTPDNIARYRASRRQSRPGAADQRFGAVSNNSGDNAYNLLHTAETSEIAQYFLERKEAIYASRQKVRIVVERLAPCNVNGGRRAGTTGTRFHSWPCSASTNARGRVPVRRHVAERR